MKKSALIAIITQIIAVKILRRNVTVVIVMINMLLIIGINCHNLAPSLQRTSPRFCNARRIFLSARLTVLSGHHQDFQVALTFVTFVPLSGDTYAAFLALH